jgi:hypothetical protein
MAFTCRWTLEAESAFQQLEAAARVSPRRRARDRSPKSSREEGLFRQVEKCIRLLRANPRHPGLHTHEYSSIENPFDSRQKVFEAYAQNRTPGAYRVFWCYGPGDRQIAIIAITPHP